MLTPQSTHVLLCFGVTGVKKKIRPAQGALSQKKKEALSPSGLQPDTPVSLGGVRILISLRSEFGFSALLVQH